MEFGRDRSTHELDRNSHSIYSEKLQLQHFFEPDSDGEIVQEIFNAGTHKTGRVDTWTFFEILTSQEMEVPLVQVFNRARVIVLHHQLQ